MSPSATEDIALLAAAVREAALSTDLRAYLGDDKPPGLDEALWKVLGRQIGVPGLVIPEQYDGAGAGMDVLAAALSELGATLAAVPALTSAGMTPCLLLAAGVNDQGAALLRKLAQVDVTATVLWSDRAADGVPSGLNFSVGPDGPRVSGDCSFVLDGARADLVVAAVVTDEGPALVSIPVTGAGVDKQPMTTIDLTRGMTAFQFDDVAVEVVTPVVAPAVLASAYDLALVCLAAEMVGLAAECLDRAVAWAKERVQFGRPIGSYQAIKHTLVDLLMEVELARSALEVAVAAAADLLEEPNADSRSALVTAASMAKAVCGDAAVKVADETLHVFGGIGFTWEHDSHLYLRRAKTLELLMGDPASHRARMAASLGVS